MTTNSEMVKVAEWSDHNGLKLFPPKYKRVRLDNEFENKTYIVTSILVRPSESVCFHLVPSALSMYYFSFNCQSYLRGKD